MSSQDLLQTIPNIGKATASDLRRLGIQTPKDLSGRNPRALYARLCHLDGERHDPCVEDVFAAAIHFVNTGEARRWWEFSRQRQRA